MEQSREKRKLPVPALAGIIAAVVIVILIGAYCGLCKWVQDNARLLPGTQAQDSTGAVVLDLGGVNQQDAVSQLSAYMEKHLEGRTLTLGYGDGKRVELSGSMLESDPQAAMDRGMEAKADQPFLKLGILWLGLGRETVSLPMDALSFTPEGEREARRLLEQIAEELYVAPVDFTYEVGDEELTLTRGTDGEEVDVDALMEQVREALSSGQTQLTVETQTVPTAELNGEILAELVYVEPQASQVLEDGTRVPLEDDRLYRVVTGLYTGQMLGTVNDQSFGILAITPKDAQGNVITDYEEHIIYNPNGSEVKEWYALASYLQSMGEVDGRYAAPEGRKVEHATWNPLSLLKNLNLFGWLAVLAAVLVLAAAVLLVWRLCFHHRRGRYGGRRRGGGYRPYRG